MRARFPSTFDLQQVSQVTTGQGEAEQCRVGSKSLSNKCKVSGQKLNLLYEINYAKSSKKQTRLLKSQFIIL
jgi:hypothetical protein